MVAGSGLGETLRGGDPDNAPVGITAGRAAAAQPRVRPARARVDEDVLCVPRTTIFPDGAWHGLVTWGLERLLRTVRAASEYQPRGMVEDDPGLQQIIPYCVVRHPHDDTYLITRRLRRSSERRLHHLYSLGIGGHVNPSDGGAGDPVIGGLRREWAEEIRCPSPATARLVAALNDDSSPVSKVHLGLVFLVEPTLGFVDVRETHKLEGDVMPLEDMRDHYLSMESWSQLVFDDLMSGAGSRADRSPLVIELDAAP
jgi:predicted NUDIX family phosphoesterase